MDHTDPIVSAVLSMTAAFNNGDMSGILSAYEPEAVVVGKPGQPLTGAATLRAMFAEFIALKPSFSYSGHEVVKAGDLALHISPWRMTGVAPDGTLIEQRGLSLAVLRRQPNGRWLMVIDQPYGDALLRAVDPP